MRKTKPSLFLTAFVKITGFLPAWLFFKPRVFCDKGAKRRLPKPCILVSNHTSLLDFPLYLIVFLFRNIRFLMAEVLFKKGRLFSWFLYKLGGIFVDRDIRDFSFIGDCLTALEKGDSIGIFPQSRLPVNNVKFPFKPSVVMIAARTDAPIIPVYTDGNYGLFKRAAVMIGKPIYLKELCGDENLTAEKIEELRAYIENSVDELQIALEEKLKNGKK